jgi:glycosyltransferase involved in cell wall biosynthesis
VSLHPSALPSVSVCFPAYNEEATIAGVLEEAEAMLTAAGLDYEILVCDDGSRDRTGAIVDGIAARLPRLRAMHHPQNRGIYETFEHLYREATREFVFLNSTDRQWDTRILLDMLPLTAEWDVVIASRRAKHYGWLRTAISGGFNLVPRLLFGVRTEDAGAVKLVRREIIERCQLVSRSPFSEAERLVRAARAGYRITTRPVTTAPRRAGRSRGVSPALVVDSLRDVARVWWALRREPAAPRKIDHKPAESSHADRR